MKFLLLLISSVFADPRLGLYINAYQPTSYFCVSDEKFQIKAVEGLKYCEYAEASCRFFYSYDGETDLKILDKDSIVRCDLTKSGTKLTCDDVGTCSKKKLSDNVSAALVKSGQEGVTVAIPRVKKDAAQ